MWSGLAAVAASIAYDVVQILQIAGVLHFPYDEILIFGTSLCIIVPFVLEILAVHHSTSDDDRFWTHAAVIFATIYAVFAPQRWLAAPRSSTARWRRMTT